MACLISSGSDEAELCGVFDGGVHGVSASGEDGMLSTVLDEIETFDEARRRRPLDAESVGVLTLGRLFHKEWPGRR